MTKQVITTKNGTTYERNWDVKGYYTHLNIRINEDIMQKLRKIADKKQLKYSDIVRNLIEDYLIKEGE